VIWRPSPLALVAMLVAAGMAAAGCRPAASDMTRATPAAAGVAGPQPIRLAGSVEASRATTVLVPRMAGQSTPTMIITSLARAGSHVQKGDVIIEFDPQDQLRAARDRQAEITDLDGQIAKKKTEQAVTRARDETELAEAGRNVERAALEVKKNDLVARVEAQKNSLALEQSRARLVQLKETFQLKRQAAAAELRILEIQRERAERALRYAEGNTAKMRVEAPFPGLVVLKQIYQGSQYVDVQEGQDVRPGLPVVDIVDPTSMQVRARVPQSDVSSITPGQAAKVRLDAYPDLVFDGRVDSVAPLGIPSVRTPKIRTFTVVVAIKGTSAQLMPDLSASVEIVPAASARAGTADPANP
jgi:multidrug resistance efflux pump